MYFLVKEGIKKIFHQNHLLLIFLQHYLPAPRPWVLYLIVVAVVIVTIVDILVLFAVVLVVLGHIPMDPNRKVSMVLDHPLEASNPLALIQNEDHNLSVFEKLKHVAQARKHCNAEKTKKLFCVYISKNCHNFVYFSHICRAHFKKLFLTWQGKVVVKCHFISRRKNF